MPVSYLSSPTKENPYVLPIDLGLMSQVLQQKEGEYLKNKEQLQQTVNNFAGLDVMKGEDRQYLNSKVNSLVNNINTTQNADLSDPNVFSQLESYASNIYGDPKVMNAVTGTQQVRKVQQEYNEYKTNPKMKGMFSMAYYARDMAQAQQWLADGQSGSQYYGPTSATPGVDVDKKGMEIAKDIKAREYSYDQNNGLYIERSTGKSLTEDQVQQVVAQRLMNIPEYASQVQANAWYLTEGQGLTGKDIIGHNSQLLGNQLEDIDSNISKNKELLRQAANDTEHKKLYSDRINDLTTMRSKVQQQKDDLDKNGLNNYAKNPSAYQTNYYLNNFTAGLAATYAFREEKHELRPDQTVLFKYRYDQQERELSLRGAEKGFTWEHDPTTNSNRWVFTGLPGQTPSGNGIVNSGIASPNRVSDTDSLAQNSEKLGQEVGSLEAQKKGFLVQFLGDAVRSDPNLKFLKDQNGKFAGQDILTQLGKTGSFDISDLSPTVVNQALAQHQITPQQAQWYGALYQAYQDKAEGKPVDVSKFPEGFEQSADNMQELNNEIDFRKNQLHDANSYLQRVAGLSNADVDKLTDYQLHPQQYTHQEYVPGDVFGGSGRVDVVSPDIKRLQDKIDALPKDVKTQYWDDVSRRVQYPYGVDTARDKNGRFAIAPLLKQAHDAGNVVGTPISGTFTPDDIKAVGYHRNEDPATSDRYPYIADATVTIPDENGKKHDVVEQIGLNPVLAQQRGLTVGSRKLQNITDEVIQSNRGSLPRIVSNPQTGFSIKVVINKLTNDPNDYRSQARVMVPSSAQDDGYDYVKIGPPMTSPSEAYSFAENFISNYKGTDFQQFVSDANAFNSRPAQ